MITREQIPQVVGHPVHDAQGKKIGDAKHMYLDDATGLPEWVTVKTGFFGNNETFVPTRAAKIVQDHVEVPYEKDKVKGAPNVDVDSGGHLSAEEERHLYRYYGLDSRGGEAGTQGGMGTGEKAAAAGGAAGAAGAAGRGRHARRDRAEAADPSAKGTQPEMSGSEAGTGTAAYAAGRSGAAERLGTGESRAAAGDEMTRSEEEMHVRVERQAAGRARLHKVVDVEEVEQTVPIVHEEVRLERTPITDAERAAGLGDISEAERIVTLHEDKPVVETEVVAKERVRMRVEEHTEQRKVHGRVRKERIETEMAGEPGTERSAKSSDEEGLG
ncbi:PRC and DUF2382 domain-containing protein [Streptomyces sp. CA2R106]|uniref:PRC and DUF2382 domain-containing protein n=1 Tax=Streptomyces sp. CA2R106 TaxID=3120153 RepID=UPI00300A7323